MEFQELQLRCELLGHQEDVSQGCELCFMLCCGRHAAAPSMTAQVRALVSSKQGVWTASRDKTLKLWIAGDDRVMVSGLTLVCPLHCMQASRCPPWEGFTRTECRLGTPTM